MTADEVDQLLTKAAIGPLAGEDCSQLSQALNDLEQSAKWVQIGAALRANWVRSNAAAVGAAQHDRWAGQAVEAAKLNVEQLNSLWETLSALGRKDLAQKVGPAWMAAGEQWKQLEPGQFSKLQVALQDNPLAEAAAARSTLAGHAWATYLSAKTLFDQGKAWEYMHLAAVVGGGLSVEQKTHVLDEFASRFPTTGQAFRELSVKDALTFAGAMASCGQRSKAGDTLAEWTFVNSSKWKAGTAKEIAEIGYVLRAGSSNLARNQSNAVASHVWGTLIGPDADPAAVTAPDFVHLVVYFHPSLSAEQKKTVARGLIDRCVRNPEQLSPADIRKARIALGCVGSNLGIAYVIAPWVSRTNKWMLATPPDLAFLLDHLRPQEGRADVRQAIDKLFAHARSQQMLHGEQLKAVAKDNVDDWLALTEAIGYFLHNRRGDQIAVAALIKEVFVQDQQAAAKLSPAQLTKLCFAMRKPELWRETSDVVAAWLAGNDCSHLSADDLAAVGRCFQEATGSGVTGSRTSIGAAIWNNYLSKDEFYVGKDPTQLSAFILNVQGLLSDQQRSQAADKLLQQAVPEDLSGLGTEGLTALINAFSGLKQPVKAADLVFRWVEVTDAWKQLDPYELGILARTLKGGTEDHRAKARDVAEKAVEAKLTAAGADLSASELSHLAKFMQAMGLTGKGMGNAKFAEALAEALKGVGSAGSSAQCHLLALPLGTAETRQALSNIVTDDAGRVRREVANVLAWAHKEHLSLNEWRTQVDAKANESAGDGKAGWLLARADAESIAGASAATVRLWLDQAHAAAGSASVKLDAVASIAGGYLGTGQHEAGLKYLDQVAANFPDAESKAKLDALRTGILDSMVLGLEKALVSYSVRIAALEKEAQKHAAAGSGAVRAKLLKMVEGLRRESATMEQSMEEWKAKRASL